jgi:hypothetical protein
MSCFSPSESYISVPQWTALLILVYTYESNAAVQGSVRTVAYCARVHRCVKCSRQRDQSVIISRI